jgi:ADP-ribose pyrophosphatase YjhB (NUDIX family)
MERNVNQLGVDRELALFLRDHAPMCSEQATWLGGEIELDLTTYVTSDTPPDALTTSGRCIVLSDFSALMMHNPSGNHILPGGRRERGEPLRSATIREVAEETGLAISPPKQLGVIAFRHLTPKPVNYPYPYPVFMNIVYVTRVPEQSQVAVNDTYELAGEFVALHNSCIRLLPLHQQILMAAAVNGERT